MNSINKFFKKIDLQQFIIYDKFKSTTQCAFNNVAIICLDFIQMASLF